MSGCGWFAGGHGSSDVGIPAGVGSASVGWCDGCVCDDDGSVAADVGSAGCVGGGKVGNGGGASVGGGGAGGRTSRGTGLAHFCVMTLGM